MTAESDQYEANAAALLAQAHATLALLAPSRIPTSSSRAAPDQL
jgi:hypothetical protein